MVLSGHAAAAGQTRFGGQSPVDRDPVVGSRAVGSRDRDRRRVATVRVARRRGSTRSRDDSVDRDRSVGRINRDLAAIVGWRRVAVGTCRDDVAVQVNRASRAVDVHATRSVAAVDERRRRDVAGGVAGDVAASFEIDPRGGVRSAADGGVDRQGIGCGYGDVSVYACGPGAVGTPAERGQRAVERNAIIGSSSVRGSDRNGTGVAARRIARGPGDARSHDGCADRDQAVCGVDGHRTRSRCGVGAVCRRRRCNQAGGVANESLAGVQVDASRPHRHRRRAAANGRVEEQVVLRGNLDIAIRAGCAGVEIRTTKSTDGGPDRHVIVVTGARALDDDLSSVAAVVGGRGRCTTRGGDRGAGVYGDQTVGGVDRNLATRAASSRVVRRTSGRDRPREYDRASRAVDVHAARCVAAVGDRRRRDVA